MVNPIALFDCIHWGIGLLVVCSYCCGVVEKKKKKYGAVNLYSN